ncbi:MAG TPA: hypothetical protein PLZ71_10460, partial [Flavobacterium alvei]|nr:hypothetical protein [Flavobacterium alvei]
GVFHNDEFCVSLFQDKTNYYFTLSLRILSLIAFGFFLSTPPKSSFKTKHHQNLDAVQMSMTSHPFLHTVPTFSK